MFVIVVIIAFNSFRMHVLIHVQVIKCTLVLLYICYMHYVVLLHT